MGIVIRCDRCRCLRREGDLTWLEIRRLDQPSLWEEADREHPFPWHFCSFSCACATLEEWRTDKI